MGDEGRMEKYNRGLATEEERSPVERAQELPCFTV